MPRIQGEFLEDMLMVLDRGSSPTVREGVNLRDHTPSLTVGLLPRNLRRLLGEARPAPLV